MKLFLGSQSPRRRDILGMLGVPFEVISVEVDEDALTGEFKGNTHDLAEYLARCKTEAVMSAVSSGTERARHCRYCVEDDILITADTTVIMNDQVLGKPGDSDEAIAVLRLLRGQSHEVVTGLAISRGSQIISGSATTKVFMRNYSDEEIRAYVSSGDPMDKAGSYAIQNEQFHPVERIEGCYYNVVGLPICLVARYLEELGVLVGEDCAGNKGCRWSDLCKVG